VPKRNGTFIWISRSLGLRGGILAAVLLSLTGCDQVSDRLTQGLSQIGTTRDATSEGIRTLALLGGAVRVRGPEGYCVDQAASNARRGFAVMAGCALLSEDVAIMPSTDALIAVQFGAEGTASIGENGEAFASFLKTETGRTLLSQEADATSVSDLTTVLDRVGVLARFEDASGPAIGGTSGPQWRGFLDVDGRLTTVSVLSFDRNPLGRSEGERLLVVAMTELVEANGSGPNETPIDER